MKTNGKTNGNGKYMKGDDALVRARKIYVLRHYGEMTLGQIAEVLDLTGERVRQVLKTHHRYSLYLMDMSSEPPAFVRIHP